jgi:hypothetical protein
MVDYAMPLDHFRFPDRRDRARHEREGTSGAFATPCVATAVGRSPVDAIGYPHVVDIALPSGRHEIVFASDAGRIAGRPAEYVANRRERTDPAPAGASQARRQGPAPAAQHVAEQHGSVEIPKGKQ